MKATLLALTLNERQGVEAVLPLIDRSAFHQIFVVDGGSTDGTIEWCREHGFEVYVQQRPGIRFAQGHADFAGGRPVTQRNLWLIAELSLRQD